jgi:hypothetical protein
VEAPHLTTLHEKYKGKGFQVLAVNCWNEDRKKVEDFVNQKKLTHPIALHGQRIADKYDVHVYPTTFWLDREGRFVHREVGFPGAESLEAKIKELLGDEG